MALGDVHRHQVPQVNAAYPGSLERLDFNDLEGDKIVLEVDLAAGAGHDDFLLRHPLATRPLIDIGIDCADCDPGAVLRQVEAAVAGTELAGAVVRVRLTSLARDVYHALDFARLDALFVPCLHHSVTVGPRRPAESTPSWRPPSCPSAPSPARVSPPGSTPSG